jgi:hypothetical protein
MSPWASMACYRDSFTFFFTNYKVPHIIFSILLCPSCLSDQIPSAALRFQMLCVSQGETKSEFLATDPEVPGSIPGATRFSEKWWVWNGVHSAS